MMDGAGVAADARAALLVAHDPAAQPSELHARSQVAPQLPAAQPTHDRVWAVSLSHTTVPLQLPCAQAPSHTLPWKPGWHASHASRAPVAWSHVTVPLHGPSSQVF